MEKKRRARINESLQELRLLIADAEVRWQVQYWERLLVVPVVVYALVKRCLLPATSCDVFSNFTSLSPATAAIKDGERRSAGDDSETCGEHLANTGSR